MVSSLSNMTHLTSNEWGVLTTQYQLTLSTVTSQLECPVSGNYMNYTLSKKTIHSLSDGQIVFV